MHLSSHKCHVLLPQPRQHCSLQHAPVLHQQQAPRIHTSRPNQLHSSNHPQQRITPAVAAAAACGSPAAAAAAHHAAAARPSWRCAAAAAQGQQGTASLDEQQQQQQQQQEAASSSSPSADIAAAGGDAAASPSSDSSTVTPISSRSSSGNGAPSNTRSHKQAAPPLQVTRHNFYWALPELQSALQTCQFYSFDCEMSGLYPPGCEDYPTDDVDDRYLKTATAAEDFIVTQMGLSLFSWTGSHYEARSFNFHLFPSPSEELDLRFSCQASSLAFLAGHGFDFNKMIYEGIPFLPLSLRDRQARAAAEAHKAAATPPALDELDDDEVCLLQELQESISNWLQQQPPPLPAAAAAADPADAAAAGGGGGGADAAADVLHLPPPPPQLMKLQRRLLAAGIGSSRWKGSGSTSSSSTSSSTSGRSWQYVVESIEGSGTDTILRRATPEAVSAAAAASKQQRQQQATRASGFSQVLELLRDSQKPAVGHNLRFDVAYVLAGFAQKPLPKTWSGFKVLVGKWFPGGLYDTKYLARALPGGLPGSSAGVLPDSGLGPLFKVFAASSVTQQPLGSAWSTPQSDAAPHAHSVNTASLADWLAERTAALDAPNTWATLPPVLHAHGCEQYAAVAADLATGSTQQRQQQQQQQQPSAGGAHEAGFDAFMTGLVFVGLLRLYEIAGLSSMSRWMLPSAPVLPPPLSAVEGLGGRQYHAKSRDVPYAALQGQEVMPARPHVVYVTGFKGGRTRWQDIQARFTKLGFGRPVVALVRDGAPGGTHSQVKGAYVLLGSAKEAAKAIQLLRADKSLTAMTYADYFISKGHGGSGGEGEAVSRPVPPSIVLPDSSPPKPSAADSLKVVQELQVATAAAKTAAAAAGKQQQQQQQQQEAGVVQEEQQQEQQQEGPADAADSDSSSRDSTSSTSSKGSSTGSQQPPSSPLLSAQQRLKLVKPVRPPQLQTPLQRPVARPAGPPAGSSSSSSKGS